MTRVEAVAAANLQHLGVCFQHHPRKDAALYPKAIVLCRELPMLIEVMIKPFRPAVEAPLQRELEKMRERRDFPDDEIQALNKRY